MRLSLLLRSAFLAFTVSSIAILPGCGKKEATPESASAESASAEDELTEKHPAATVGWVVTPDGLVQLHVKSPDGTPISKTVTGTVTAKPLEKGAKPTTATLAADAKPGAYLATLPKLNADLTDVSYTLDVGGKPVVGTLHLPRGGTKQLVASAKAAEGAKAATDKKGPHGGLVQVVGNDVLEIVADKGTGQVRVYVLDDDLKPIPVGKRRVKLAAVAGSPELVELQGEPGGLYFTGKFTGKSDPVKLTVVLYEEDAPEPVVVLCGWHPTQVIVVGPGAPAVTLFVVTGWPAVVIVNPSPVVVVQGPPVVVFGGKGKGKGKFGKVHIKIH